MRPWFERPPAPVLLAQIAALVVGVAALVGGGVGLGFWLDEPVTITETITHDAPPACDEIAPLRQAEWATLAYLEDAADNARALSAGLGPVALTKDSEQILDHAADLDDANRKEQKLRLQLSADLAATDAAIADCTREREQ